MINTDLDPSYVTSFYSSSAMTNGILIGEIFPEVSIYNTDKTRIQLYGTAGITLSERLTIQNEFEFDNRGEYDPHFQGSVRESVPGWVGYLQHTSLNYFYSLGHLSLGRGNPYFFNMNENLLLNPHFPPAEYMWWQHEIKWFQFDWGILLLNKMGDLNRFLTFHRYGIKNKNWRIGFTEAVLSTYENWGSEETGYIMPAAVLLETEENRGINANLIWLFDGMIKWKKWTFYGEFLIDDYALDGLSPPQIAVSIGLGRKFDKALINLEYIRINRWTGNYCDPLKRWIEVGVPIGHSIGADAHRLQMSTYIPIKENIAVDFSIGWINSGKGNAINRLKEQYPVPCDINFGYNSEPFPSSNNNSYDGVIKVLFLIQEKFILKLKLESKSEMPPSMNLMATYKLKN